MGICEKKLKTKCQKEKRYNIDFIYHCTFFEITKFSKILSKSTFFRKFSKILSNLESIFEKSVNFKSIFKNFVNSKKMSMVDEVTINITSSKNRLLSSNFP